MNNIFGKRLKELREEYNIKQTELAKSLKVSSPAISQYEKGTRTPDFQLLISIADYFGVSLDYLLGRHDDREYNYLKRKTLQENKQYTNDKTFNKTTISEDDILFIKKMIKEAISKDKED